MPHEVQVFWTLQQPSRISLFCAQESTAWK